MKFFISYLKQRKMVFIAFILFALIFICSFALYHISVKSVVYPFIVCSFFGLAFLVSDYLRRLKKHKTLEKICAFTDSLADCQLPANTIDDEDYQKIITLLMDEQKRRDTQMNMKYSDMIDYYTLWVHQIKTPIAAMKLNLQNYDNELSRTVSEDLFKIEQYVEMVLVFLRLDSDYTDYVIKEYSVDDIIKCAVKKFAVQFISKKIRLNYDPVYRTTSFQFD